MFYMRQKIPFYCFILLIFQVCSQSDNRCCVSYDATKSICLTCPPNTFLSGNNCIINISGCQIYADCFTCSQCSKNMNFVDTQVNARKTKKCQQPKIFTEINIADPSKNGQAGQGYLIVNDFFRSSHRDIASAQTMHALHQKFQNGTQIITIQYVNTESTDLNNKFFRGTMIINLSSFIFKQTEFKNIPQNQIRKIQLSTPNLSEINQNLELNTRVAIGSTTTFADRTEKILTLNSNSNAKLIQQINFITQGNNKIYQNLILLKLITLRNETQLIQANYKRFDDGTNIILIDLKTKSITSITENSPPPPPPPPIPTPITPPIEPTPPISPPMPTLPPTLPPTPAPKPTPEPQIIPTPIPTPKPIPIPIRPPNPPPSPGNTNNNGNGNGKNNGNNGNNGNNANNGNGKGGLKKQTGYSQFGLEQMKRDRNLGKAFEYAKSLDNKIVSERNFFSGYSQRQLLSINYKLYFLYDYRIYEVYFIEDLVKRRNILRSFNQVLYADP